MVAIHTERDVAVEMRDGVPLSTDVYRPTEGGAYPALLMRLPYDKDNPGSVGRVINPLNAVEKGYVVVIQDTRGRFSSDGKFDPYRDDQNDGYDTVEWIADQTWCNGKVGTFGASYKGITAWQTIAADPPHLKAGVPMIAASNLHDGWAYSNGAFELGFNLTWAMSYLLADTLGRLDRPADEMASIYEQFEQGFTNPREMLEWLPLTDVPVFDNEAGQYWREWLNHPSYDEYWKQTDVNTQVEDISVPVLHVSGWYDSFFRGHTDFYEAMEERAEEDVRENHRMVIGPWDHSTAGGTTPTMSGDKDFGIDCVISQVMGDLALQWFDYWLKDEESGAGDLPKVRYYMMGANEWRETEEWPPEHSPTQFYLSSAGTANTRFGNGVLTKKVPDESVPPDSFKYDPFDPVPSCGGNIFMDEITPAGVQDQSQVEERDDVLVYTSPRLTSEVEIAGPVRVTLHAASSTSDTDFTAKLVDVEPDGYCANIAEGIVRGRYRSSREEAEFMEPGKEYEFNIDLWSTAHTFRENHQIRLEISSSNFPRFDRNPNTKVSPSEATADDFAIASQEVFHDAERPSHLTLPVIE
jgi:putative CocE/NonD family hydrolase